jgi:heptosyltransferase-2
MSINPNTYYTDCLHFDGTIPCKPHKAEGVKCERCDYYTPISKKILIIKLGAIGDVIRTTPLLTKLRAEYPNCQIYWITDFPAILPKSKIDRIFSFDAKAVTILEETKFDIAINLDKDYPASALMNKINADEKFGFCLKDGVPSAQNPLAEHKFVTGLFDDVNKANTKSYQEEMFEICGFKFAGEEYLLDFDKSIAWDIKNGDKKIIGLNTGCGDRWVSRLWAEENWEKLCTMLLDNGYYPLLLGGKQEHEKNSRLSEKTGAAYLGHFSLQEFISLCARTDLMVSAVTMGMHLAVGLKKPLVLINNIFNPHEFELYGKGEIVSPDKECTCYFSPKCKNEEYFCMEHLPVEKIFEAINRHI